MKLVGALSLSLVTSIFAGNVFAHATFENNEATLDTYYKAVLNVPHGCDGQSTLKVRVTIPEGVISVKPMPKAGWVLETKSATYQNTYSLHGKDISKGVKEIVWTGELADSHFDQFIFRGRLDGSLGAGRSVYFPTVQECASDIQAWDQIPAEGQDPHDLSNPAPGVKLVAPDHQHSH